MEKELWDKCQQLIEIGQINLVMPILVKEFQDNLTEEQFNKLGDIARILTDTFSKKQEVTAEQFIQILIEMTRNGHIIGSKNKG